MVLVDRFGREATDLRVSVTRRCNFSCIYCHNEGLGAIKRPGDPHDEELAPEEIERVVRIAREFDFTSLHLTGGEAMVRPDLEEIVARSARHIPDVSLTTNGSMLAPRAERLREAGLRRVNISIDSIHAEVFKAVRGADIHPVLKGIVRALEVGLTPVKLNMVVMKYTLPQIPRMLEYVEKGRGGLVLQLIQYMPELTGHEDWMVDIDGVAAWLAAEADHIDIRRAHSRRIYCLKGARVEIVDPVYNQAFCENCHRIRLTHDGKLKGCLNRNDDLLATRGASDEGIRAAFRQVVANRVPYYGAYIRDFPKRDLRRAKPVPLETGRT
ncbi:MAG: GTP 3',8-cyclase MoaA [Thermoplasmata archaeon]